MPGRNKFAFLSIQRRIIDCKNHTHCRFIHFNPLESLRSDKISKCIPYFEILKTNNCTEVTTSDTISFSSPKSFKYIKFLDSYLLDLSIPFAQSIIPVSYTHLRAHETVLDLVCRLLLEKKK